MKLSQKYLRFLKYSLVGIATFLLDLGLLFLLTDVFGWHYLVSVACAFLFAVTLNYIISRRVVFIGSERTISR